MDNAIQRVLTRYVPAITALFFFAAISGVPARAELLSYLPYGAKPEGSLRLCMAPGSEAEQFFTCRDYRTPDGTYSVLFQGGRTPRLLVKTLKSGETVVQFVREFQEYWQFDLAQPFGVPLQARHVGTGVCTDPQKRLVPCAVFWETSDIRGEILSYLVLYDPLGGGPLDVNVIAFSGRPAIGNIAGGWR